MSEDNKTKVIRLLTELKDKENNTDIKNDLDGMLYVYNVEGVNNYLTLHNIKDRYHTKLNTYYLNKTGVSTDIWNEYLMFMLNHRNTLQGQNLLKFFNK